MDNTSFQATNQHLTADDYEHPEDVITELQRVGGKLFGVVQEGLRIKYSNEYKSVFISKDKLDSNQTVIFNRLKANFYK